MKRILPVMIGLMLSASSQAQCNACQDSVSIYEGMMNNTFELWVAGSLNKDIGVNVNHDPPPSVYCSGPHYDGNGHCVSNCSDGSSVVTNIGQTKCLDDH